MLKNFSVDNYRGFRHVELDNLTRFSLITGPNNYGKTSLLEALIMFASGPNAPFKGFSFELMRGLQPAPINAGVPFGAGALFPNMWTAAFRDFDSFTPIVLKGTSTNGRSRTISISRQLHSSVAQLDVNPGTISDSSQQLRSVVVEVT